MQAEQTLLDAAAEHLVTNVRLYEDLSRADYPPEAVERAQRLVAACDLLLTVAIFKYLREIGRP